MHAPPSLSLSLRRQCPDVDEETRERSVLGALLACQLRHAPWHQQCIRTAGGKIVNGAGKERWQIKRRLESEQFSNCAHRPSSWPADDKAVPEELLDAPSVPVLSQPIIT